MGAPCDEEVYNDISENNGYILNIYKDTKSKEEFLGYLTTKEELDRMFHYLRFCFQRVNEVSYKFLEEGVLPEDPRYVMCGISVISFAAKLEVWDTKEKNLFFYVCEFATGDINKNVALKIIQQQEEIETLYEALHLDWQDLQVA